jgi:hypothetical protein
MLLYLYRKERCEKVNVSKEQKVPAGTHPTGLAEAWVAIPTCHGALHVRSETVVQREFLHTCTAKYILERRQDIYCIMVQKLKVYFEVGILGFK